MAAAAARGVLKCCEFCGYCCQAIAYVVDGIKFVCKYISKVLTCGQGWKGLYENALSLIISEEDPDDKDFSLPEAEGRNITDIPILVIFIIMLLGMMATMNRAIAYGRPEVYFQGVDSWGNVCGYKNEPIKEVEVSGADMTKFTKVLIFDFIMQSSKLTADNSQQMSDIKSTTTMCVNSCPLITQTFNCWEFFEQQSAYAKPVLDFFCSAAAQELKMLKEQSLSFAERNSRCIPDLVSKEISVEKQNKMLSLYSSNWVYNFIADCMTCSPELTWLSLISVGFTLLFVAVIQGASAAICWFSFAMFFLIGIASSSFMWYLYSVISSADTAVVIYADDDVYTMVVSQNTFGNYSSAWMRSMSDANKAGSRANTDSTVPQAGYSIVFRDAAIFVTVATVAFSIVCLLVGSRNMDATAVLFTEAIGGLMKLGWVYLIPFVTLGSLCLATGMFLYTVSLLTSVFQTDPKVMDDPMFSIPKVVLEQDTVYTNGVLVFEVIASAWVFNFIISCQNMVTSLAMGTWYFTIDRDDLDRPMRVASSRLIRKHLGSAAVGAFLVGFLGWMRAPISFLQSRLNRLPVEDKPPDTYSYDVSLSKNSKCSTVKKSGSISVVSSKTKIQNNKEIPKASLGPYDTTSHTSKKDLPESKVSLHKDYPKSRRSSYNYSHYTKTTPLTKVGTPGLIKCGRCLSKSCTPAFWILNNVLIYISDFNFSMVALKGLSFSQGGYAIRNILKENPKLKGLGAISSYCLFLGKLSVTIAVLPFGFLFLKDKEGVFVYGYPLAMGAALSFIVAHLFLSFFNAAVCTILVCFMEDTILNNGTEESPYFGSEKLFKTFDDILNNASIEDGTKRVFHHTNEIVNSQNKRTASSLLLLDSDFSSHSNKDDQSFLFELMPKKQKQTQKQEKQQITSETSAEDDGNMFSDMFDSEDETENKQKKKKDKAEKEKKAKKNKANEVKKKDGKKAKGDKDKDGTKKKTDKDKGSKDPNSKKGQQKQAEKGKTTGKDNKTKEQNKTNKSVANKKDTQAKGPQNKAENSARNGKTNKTHASKGKTAEAKPGKSPKPIDKPKKTATGAKTKKGKEAKGSVAKTNKTTNAKSKNTPGSKPKGGLAPNKAVGKVNAPKPGKMKGPKPGKIKGSKPGKMKTPKPGKMKAPKPGKMKAPKPGKMKGLKPGFKAGKKGFKGGKMKGLGTGKMKGLKPGKMKGFKAGKLKGFKAGKLKGFNPGKMKGLKMGKMRGMKGGKMGLAGAAMGGIEGAQNIADAMLRMTGQKKNVQNKLHNAAFGTRNRAKTTNVLTQIIGDRIESAEAQEGVFKRAMRMKNLVTGIQQTMQNVDDQFDEIEEYEYDDLT